MLKFKAMDSGIECYYSVSNHPVTKLRPGPQVKISAIVKIDEIERAVGQLVARLPQLYPLISGEAYVPAGDLVSMLNMAFNSNRGKILHIAVRVIDRHFYCFASIPSAVGTPFLPFMCLEWEVQRNEAEILVNA